MACVSTPGSDVFGAGGRSACCGVRSYPQNEMGGSGLVGSGREWSGVVGVVGRGRERSGEVGRGWERSGEAEALQLLIGCIDIGQCNVKEVQ